MTSISCLQSDVNYAMLQQLGIRLNWAGKGRVGNWFLILFINSIFPIAKEYRLSPTKQQQRHKEHQNDTNNEILWWIPIADKKKEKKNEREHRGKFIEKFRFGPIVCAFILHLRSKSSVLCAAKMNWIFFCPPDSIHPPSLAPDSIDWTLFSLCNFHRSPASAAQQKHAKKTTISRFYKWQRESLERRTKKRFPRELNKSRNNNSIIIHSLLCRCHVHMRLWSRRRLGLT